MASRSSSSEKEKMAVIPYCRVDASLRAMAGQAEGFGRNAVGGLHGAVYCVTTLEGNGEIKIRVRVLISYLSLLDCFECLDKF